MEFPGRTPEHDPQAQDSRFLPNLFEEEGGREACFLEGKKKKTLTRLKLSVAREGQGKFRKTPFYVLYDVYSVAQSQERDEKGCRAMRGCKSCVYLIG